MRLGIGESPTVVVVVSSPKNIRHLTSETSYRCRVVCESEHGVRSESAYEVFSTGTLLGVTVNSHLYSPHAICFEKCVWINEFGRLSKAIILLYSFQSIYAQY